jgi:hypothetical protein
LDIADEASPSESIPGDKRLSATSASSPSIYLRLFQFSALMVAWYIWLSAAIAALLALLWLLPEWLMSPAYGFAAVAALAWVALVLIAYAGTRLLDRFTAWIPAWIPGAVVVVLLEAGTAVTIWANWTSLGIAYAPLAAAAIFIAPMLAFALGLWQGERVRGRSGAGKSQNGEPGMSNKGIELTARQ